VRLCACVRAVSYNLAVCMYGRVIEHGVQNVGVSASCIRAQCV